MRSVAASIIFLVLATVLLGQNDEAKPDLPVVLQRVRERMRQYYVDLQRLSFTDTFREEHFKEDRTLKEKPKDSTYEMIIRLQEPGPDTTDIPFYVRELRRMTFQDGKPVKTEKLTESKNADIGWPLFLVLHRGRGDGYHYTYAGQADLDGHKTVMLDVTFPGPVRFVVGRQDKLWEVRSASASRDAAPRVIWDGDNFAIDGLKVRGKLWIDADTYSLLQLESRTEPFEFERQNSRQKIRFEFVKTFSLRSMSFENPSETFLVPEFSETTTTALGAKVGGPVRRIRHSFGDFKRFTGDVKITPLGDPPPVPAERQLR